MGLNILMKRLAVRVNSLLECRLVIVLTVIVVPQSVFPWRFAEGVVVAG